MDHLSDDGRTAMAVFLEQGYAKRAVARLHGANARAVRYHRKCWSVGSIDGRSKQALKGAAYAEAI